MATIKTLSEETGLSVTTVSKYLNGGNVLAPNREAIEKAIRKYNFHINYIARYLKTSHTNTVGIVLPSFKDVFHTGLFHYVEAYLREYGYSVQIVGSGGTLENERAAITTLINRKVDAIFLFPILGAVDNANYVITADIPLVVGDQFLEGVNADFVLYNNMEISKKAMDILLQNGHSKIALVGADKKYYTANERFLGYQKSLIDNDIAINPNYIKESEDFDFSLAKESVTELLEMKDPPTAIFTTNYYMTIGAIAAINDKGLKIGSDISIIGYDSIYLSEIVSPKLTIIEQPFEEAGKAIADILVKRINCGNYNYDREKIFIQSKLHEGKSVKKLN